MNFLQSIRADLVDKRLMPVVIALAALAILVPVGALTLSGSSSSPPALGPPPVTAPPPGTPSPGKALAAVSDTGVPPATHYVGRELDPFRLSASAAAAATGATAAAKTPAGGPSGPSGSAAKINPKTAAAGKPTTPAAKPTTPPAKPTTPAVKPTPTTTTTPAPAPTVPAATPSPKAQLAKLRSRDSYSIDVNVADATGVHSLSNLERLSPLPGATNPLVEYLGVLKNGRAAAFLVNPGTAVSGPGACLPRTGDCQLLVLKPGQLEALGVRGVVQASIAVSGWRVVTHSTVAAARKARSQEVKQGRALVTQSAQPALTAVVYSVAQGAVSVATAVVNALPGLLSKLLGG